MSNEKIKLIKARKILNSRCEFTVEAEWSFKRKI